MSTSISALGKHKIISIEVDESVAAAYELMKKHRIRHLVVADGEECIGVISDRDLQRATRSEISITEGRKIIELSVDPSFTVRDFLSWPVKSVEASLSIREVNRRMIREKISAFLVTDNGQVTGIVTHEDLLLYLDSLLAKEDGSLGLIDRLKLLAAKSPIGPLVDELASSGI